MYVCEVMTVLDPGTSPAVVTAHPQQDITEVLTVLRLAGLDAVAVVQDGVVIGSVSREGMVRGLAPNDTTIAADVRCRLAHHPEITGWAVAVHAGEVVLRREPRPAAGDRPDPVESRLVEQLAGTVIGVTNVRVPENSPYWPEWDVQPDGVQPA